MKILKSFSHEIYNSWGNNGEKTKQRDNRNLNGRSSLSRMFFKIGVLKISHISQENAVLESLLNKVASLRDCNAGVFLQNLRNFFKNTFIYRTPTVTASEMIFGCTI